MEVFMIALFNRTNSRKAFSKIAAAVTSPFVGQSLVAAIPALHVNAATATETTIPQTQTAPEPEIDWQKVLTGKVFAFVIGLPEDISVISPHESKDTYECRFAIGSNSSDSRTMVIGEVVADEVRFAFGKKYVVVDPQNVSKIGTEGTGDIADQKNNIGLEPRAANAAEIVRKACYETLEI
jgi:hypothetical protein